MTPTPDIITFMHLSIMEYNGGLTIVVTEWQHGEKIILTSELCELLLTGNCESFLDILPLSECITPLALSIFIVCMHFCSHTGAKQTQFNCISSLPCRNKHNTPQIHCTALIYITFERKSVLQLQYCGHILRLCSLLLVPETTSFT